MGTISQDLLTFQSKIGSNIDSMKSKCGDIKNKLISLTQTISTARSGVDSYYNSNNKSSLLQSFSTSSGLVSKVSSSVSAELGSMLEEASAILKSIELLEKMNEQIDELKGQLSIENSKPEEERSGSTIADLNNKISDKESEFTRLCNETSQKLSTLKSKDSAISIGATTGGGGTSSAAINIGDLDKLEYGTFNFVQTTVNGVRMEYYIYIPKDVKNIDNLSMHIFFHGNGSASAHDSLIKLIDNKTVVPNGIVICPLARNNSHFADKTWQAAFMGVVDKVADEYNVNKKKISVSGYSRGARSAYQLVNSNPNYFSAFIPIGANIESTEKATSALKNLKLFAIYGEKDGQRQISTTKNIVSDINSQGGSASIYFFENEGHGNVQNYSFERTFKDSNGKAYYLLDWAMQQERA